MSQPKDVVFEVKDAFVATLRGIYDVAAQILEAATHAVRRAMRRPHSIAAALLRGTKMPGLQARRGLRR